MCDMAAEVSHTTMRQLTSMQFVDLPGVTLQWLPDQTKWRCALGTLDCTGVTPMAAVDALWRALIHSGMKQAVIDG